MDELTLSWRYVSLVEGGWCHQFAEILSNLTDVDTHEANRLLEKGCEEETAFRLILPLDMPLPPKHAVIAVQTVYDALTDRAELAKRLGISISVHQ